MVELEELVGHIAAIGSTTRETGSVIGNGLKTIFSRITTMNPAIDALSEVGVSIRDMAGNVKPVQEILAELAGKWNTLTDEQRQHTAVQVAGRYQLSRFLALMNNWHLSVDATNTALNSQGSAMEEQERYAESLEARINKLQNSWTEFSLAVGDAVLTDTLIELIESMRDLAQSSSDFVDKFGILPALFGTVGVAVVALSGKFRGLATSLIFGTAEMTRATIASNVLKASLRGLVASTGVGLLFVGLGIAVEKFIEHVGNARRVQEEFRESQEKNIEAITTNKDETDKLIESYTRLSQAKEKGDWDTEKEQEYLDIQRQLADVFPGLIESIDAQGNYHLKNVDQIQKEIDATRELIRLKKEETILNAQRTLGGLKDELGGLQGDIASKRDQMNTYEGLANTHILKSQREEAARQVNLLKQDILGLEMQVANTSMKINDEVMKIASAFNDVEIDPSIEQEINKIVSALDLSELDSGTLEGISRQISNTVQEIQSAFSSNDQAGIDKAVQSFNGYLDKLNIGVPSVDAFKFSIEDLTNAQVKNTEVTEVQIPVYDELGNIVGYSTEVIEGLTDAQDANTGSKFDNIDATQILFGVTSDQLKQIDNAIMVYNLLSGAENLNQQQTLQLADAKAFLTQMFPHLVNGSELNIQAMMQEAEVMNGLGKLSGDYASGRMSNEDALSFSTIAAVNQRIEAYKKELQALNTLQKTSVAILNNLGKQAKATGFYDNLAEQGALAAHQHAAVRIPQLEKAIASSTAQRNRIWRGSNLPKLSGYGGSSGSKGGGGSKGSKGSKGSSSSERAVEQYLTDQYALAVDNLNTKLEESEYRMSRLDKSSKQYRDEMALQINYQKQLAKLAKDEQSRLEARNRSLNSQLKSMGSFNKLSNENKEKYNDIKKEIDDNIKAINNLKSAQISANRAIDTSLNSLKDIYNDMADEIINIFKEAYSKQKELALDAIDAEMEAYRKAHNEKMAMIDKEADEESYDKELAKRQKEIQELQALINQLAMDETQKARVAELNEQLAEKQEELNQFVTDRQRELRKQSLNEELAAKEEELKDKREKTERHFEDLLNDERAFAEMREQILAGNLGNIQNQLGQFSELIKSNMQNIGQSISQNLIDKIKEASDTLKSLKGGSSFFSDAVDGKSGKSINLTDINKNNSSKADMVTLKKDAVLFQPDENGTLTPIKSLKKGQKFKAYGFDEKYSMYKVGRGLLTTDVDTVKYEKFDTGGFTGSFKGGKFAMLHEKELVLNKGETKDFLSAIKLVREIKDWMPNIKLPKIPQVDQSLSAPNQVHISMPVSMTVTGDEKGGRDALNVINKGLKDIGLKLGI